jgi:hypothetical protein
MTSSTNPLMDRQRGGKVTEEDLRALADRLNDSNFARGLGLKYRVARGEDGKAYLA